MSKTRLIKLLREEFEIPTTIKINLSTNLKVVLNLSSINILVLIILIENEFNVILDDSELKKINTLQELYNLILSKNNSNV